jgi:hypothetical protein
MKYACLALNVLAVAVIGAIGWLLSNVQADRMIPSATIDVPQVQSVPRGERQRLKALSKNLDQFAFFLESSPGSRSDDLIATAEPPPNVLVPRENLLAADKKADQETQSKPAPMPRREVRVVLAGQRDMAIIDGVLVSEGDPLPGNGEVLRIDSDSVVVAETGGRRQRLTVSER